MKTTSIITTLAVAALFMTLPANGQTRFINRQANLIDLGFGYSKDQRHVYYQGEVLPYVDPTTFRVSPRYGLTQEEAYPYSDEPVYGGYHVSTFDVYFNGKKIKGAMPNSFQELGGGYAKDSFSVYYLGRKVKGATASSFRYVGRGYAEDSFDTYFNGEKIKENIR